jgi:hypothetical protein
MVAQLGPLELQQIRRGDSVLSGGREGIPAETLMFPLRVTALVTLVDGKRVSQQYEYYCYQDSFHEWRLIRAAL